MASAPQSANELVLADLLLRLLYNAPEPQPRIELLGPVSTVPNGLVVVFQQQKNPLRYLVRVYPSTAVPTPRTDWPRPSLTYGPDQDREEFRSVPLETAQDYIAQLLQDQWTVEIPEETPGFQGLLNTVELFVRQSPPLRRLFLWAAPPPPIEPETGPWAGLSFKRQSESFVGIERLRTSLSRVLFLMATDPEFAQAWLGYLFNLPV